MVALAPITNENFAWDVLDTFPKPHSRAREVKTTHCTEAPHSKSRSGIEIWLTIFESREGLESFTRDPIGYQDGPILYDLYISLLLTDPSGLQSTAPPQSGGNQGGNNPRLPPLPGATPPFLPQPNSCTISVCSSPVPGTGGTGGHLFILCGGTRYRGGPSGQGNQNKECDKCDGKHGQLVSSEEPWAAEPVDHPNHPGSEYPPSAMNCNQITVRGKSCDEVCGCIGKVGKAVDGCCIPYTPVPNIMTPPANSNSVVGWMIDTCAADFLVYVPPLPRVHPGFLKPRPDCVKKAVQSFGIVWN